MCICIYLVRTVIGSGQGAEGENRKGEGWLLPTLSY